VRGSLCALMYSISRSFASIRVKSDRAKPRALVRSREKGEAIASMATPVLGDLLAPETLADAFRGAERVFIVAPPAPEMEALERNAIDAAGAAGVYKTTDTAAKVLGRPPRSYADWLEKNLPVAS
jgi:uncharacterized protein YbjT (DUF2867 family)